MNLSDMPDQTIVRFKRSCYFFQGYKNSKLIIQEGDIFVILKTIVTKEKLIRQFVMHGNIIRAICYVKLSYNDKNEGLVGEVECGNFLYDVINDISEATH